MALDLFALGPAHRSRAGKLNAGTKLLATFLLSIGLLLIKDWGTALVVFALEPGACSRSPCWPVSGPC